MEKKLCTYSKSTEGMHRWDAMIGHAPLEIYIPRWRVPDPYPSHISVEIFEWAEYLQSINYLYQEELLANPELSHNSIVTRVTFNKDCSLTAKYKTDLNNDVREIGDPFIPKTLLSTLPPKRLVIVINWERGNGGYHNSTN